MSRRSSARGGPSPGTMSVLCLGPTELPRRRGGTVHASSHDRYEYQAPVRIAGSLAEFDRYIAIAYTLADGNRRFLPRPEDGLEGYLGRAFQIGHCLLSSNRGWSKATYEDYLVGKLAYDWLRHTRERLKPRALAAEELVTPGYLRRDLLRRDELPDELTDGDERERGSGLVNRIVAAGTAAAAARGIERPSETETIALGLMAAAAQQPPLGAAPEQLQGIIREALFDLADPEDEVTADLLVEVDERFEAAVRNRLYISQDEFNRWLYGKNAYMLQTVERGVTVPNDVRRTQVRQAMLEKAWHGLLLVNECLDAFARTFERAITRRLSAAEQRQFALMYCRQPVFGNIVLPLLLDGADLLHHAVLDVWDAPNDPQAVEVFQRMLLYRSQILPRVRETQRRARTKGQAILESLSTEGETTPRESRWTELTGHILERRGICCAQCHGPLTCTIARPTRAGQPIVLDVRCGEHDLIGQFTIRPEEFLAADAALSPAC